MVMKTAFEQASELLKKIHWGARHFPETGYQGEMRSLHGVLEGD